MSQAVPLQGQLRRSRWAEVGLTVVMCVALVAMFDSPRFLMHLPWLAMTIFTVLLLGLLGVGYRSYRAMDELQRLRYLKATSLAGGALIFGLALMIYWKVFSWPGHGLAYSLRRTVPPAVVEFSDLLLPFGLYLAVYLVVTAYLYRRDSRG